MLNFGILGINARNLLYIKKFNPNKGIRLANSKLDTKIFLSERGIPVPKTYGVIKNRMQLNDFNFSHLPKNNFVVKPNEGSKGRGVIILELLRNKHCEEVFGPTKTEAKTNNWFTRLRKKISHVINQILNFGLEANIHHNLYYKTSGKVISDYDLRRHMFDILDGRYSMTTGPDKILVEEKMDAGEGFKAFCKYGLADIRIIVFNLVPVVAMIRVPTAKSSGKANLNAGGIGFGINVSNGRIFSMTHNGKILKSNFPEEYEDFLNKKIPFWDDILFLSSKVQFFVNLGYLALDRVITGDGPKLLEINARAGIEVQNVTSTKLLRVLDKISDLKVGDPEKGVEIAKTLFTHETTNPLQNSKILYLSQYGDLRFMIKNEEKKYRVVAEVKLNKNNNYISAELFDEIKRSGKAKATIDFVDQEFNIKNIYFLPSKNIAVDKVILGKELVSEYFLKPIDKTISISDILNPSKILDTERDKLKQIDRNIHKIGNRLILASVFRPINYFDELDTFIIFNGKYNPKFKYNRPTNEKLEKTRIELVQIKNELLSTRIKSQIKSLFEEKVEELLLRINLIKSYKKRDYKSAYLYNEQLFGKIDEELLFASREKIFSHQLQNNELLGKKLTSGETKNIVKKYLADNDLSGVNVHLSSTNFSRISVFMAKQARISISKNFVFREKQLESILAHEIDIHLVRFLHGLKSGRFIFKDGVGFHLKDEEGLALYSAEKIRPEGYDKISMYRKYFLLEEGKKLDFMGLVDLIKSLYPTRTHEGVFKTAIKIKKGVVDTSIVHEGAVFMKEKVYLDGYMKIKNYIESGGDIEKMYGGKIKIEDMDFIL